MRNWINEGRAATLSCRWRPITLLLTLALVASGFVRDAAAATIHVTTTAQGVADDGLCSLQEAIYSANFDFGMAPSSWNPLVVFDSGCAPGDGDDVIELQNGAVYPMTALLDDPHNYMGPTANPIIFTNITIAGNGARVERSNPGRDFSGVNFRAFAVGSATMDMPWGTMSGTGNLTIWNLHIKGFTARGGDGVGGGGGGGGFAGAIYVHAGALSVRQCTLQDNGARGGDGSNGANAGGGGGGGGLAGSGGFGGSATTGGFLGDGNGGGGGGSRGKGATADEFIVSGGGGGTLTGGEGHQGGYRCGGNGGGYGEDGADAACSGGGGGGGGQPDPVAPFVVLGGEGGDGKYGGGGGGGAYHVITLDHLTKRGGHGGVGGGGGATGGSAVVFDGRDIFLSSGGNGGFGGGGGAGDSVGSGGAFAGDGTMEHGGGGAGLGGAIFNHDGTVLIENSTFQGNFVVHGYGPGNWGHDAGGAIFSVGGSLTVLNSTLAANETTSNVSGGAGIVVYGSNASLTLRNTIIAASLPTPTTDECKVLGAATFAGSGNLITENHNCSQGLVTSANPLLGPLQLNVPGLTPTMAIGADSPAASHADAPTSLTTDQRGVARPKGDGPDIGAYEFGNRPPDARCRNVTVSAGESCTAYASIDNGSSDPDGDPITLAQSPAEPYSLGSTMVTLTVSDGENASSSCTGIVTVVDDTPPVITLTLASPVLTGARNHTLVNAGLGATATDGCSSAPTSFSVQVFGDEDDQTPTEGATVFSPDATNIGVGTLRLRAERANTGDGRVYLIVVRGTDGSGNTGFACTAVVVPYNNSSISLAAVNSQAAAALSYCGTPPPDYFVIGDGPVVGPKQ